MAPAKPSLDLLRSLSDEHVLRELIAERQLTRAQLATRTGLSKPTVSDSVRRLSEAGLVHDTGARTTGRGRVGTYYALADDLGAALVVSIAPEGIVAEIVNVYGEITSRASEPVTQPIASAGAAKTLRDVTALTVASGPVPLRLAVVSAADPVDRVNGRLVHLPDSPFLLGELSPADILQPLLAATAQATPQVIVDNDVHWAARAEREAALPHALNDFAYLYLGDGLGCAIVSDGEVRRGHRGIAGEIAHVLTRGPSGRATAFIDTFAELGVRRPGSTSLDSQGILQRIGADAALLSALTEAVDGVLAALVALADPEVILLGGAWGNQPDVVTAVAQRFAKAPRHVPIRAAQITHDPSLTGARIHAISELRRSILTR